MEAKEKIIKKHLHLELFTKQPKKLESWIKLCMDDFAKIKLQEVIDVLEGMKKEEMTVVNNSEEMVYSMKDQAHNLALESAIKKLKEL